VERRQCLEEQLAVKSPAEQQQPSAAEVNLGLAGRGATVALMNVLGLACANFRHGQRLGLIV